MEVVDKHLSILAKQHIETRFIKIQAEKSPFLAEKLKIVVLPTIALIKNAKVDDYVVGFDELGGTDDFSTEELEERLSKAQVIFFEGESSMKPSSHKRETFDMALTLMAQILSKRIFNFFLPIIVVFLF
ncbi:putative Thioredoxin-like superfamily [Helianthus annuus]|nr:putative Thioredoxin-like superfamily [Helianthus annuus]